MSEQRANHYEKLERIKELMPVYISGTPRRVIMIEFSEKWGISERQVENYITDVKEILMEEFAKDVGDLKNEYHKLYLKAIKECRFEDARKILDSINKYYGVKKVDITSNNQTINQPVSTIKLIVNRTEETDKKEEDIEDNSES